MPAPLVFTDYLRAQAHRSDDVGALARAFAEEVRARRLGRMYRRPANLAQPLRTLRFSPRSLDALDAVAAEWEAARVAE